MDNIAEDTETFNLNLILPSSLSGRVTPGDTVAATAIIIDETGKIELVHNYAIQ